MKDFAELYLKLERCKSNSEKKLVLQAYYGERSNLGAPSRRHRTALDAAWSICLLLNRWSLSRKIKSEVMRNLAQEITNTPDWLFDECQSTVGDLAETIALLLPSENSRAALLSSSTQNEDSLSAWLEKRIPSIASANGPEQEKLILNAWNELSNSERLIFNKLLCGSLRFNLPTSVIAEAIASNCGLEPFAIAARLQSDWQPSQSFYEALVQSDTADLVNVQPYTFISSVSVSANDQTMEFASFLAEWKWRGIRAQLVKRGGKISIWSQSQVLLNDAFPELLEEAAQLDDGLVIDGEIVPFKDADILPRQALVQRMNRKSVSKQVLEETPVVFMAFDLLEDQATDIRMQPIELRKKKLAAVLSSRKLVKSDAEFQQLTLFAPCQTQLSTKLRNSPVLQVENSEELNSLMSQARQMKVGGIILKAKESPYETGSGEHWFSMNLDAIKLDAVLIAAQPANGRRAGVFSDYTLALWQDNALMPVARVSSPLAEEETLAVDKFIRENTLAKFGPVASVKPELVFEISCDEVQVSARHKAGLTLSAARIIRRREDLDARQAHSLSSIRGLCSG